MKLNWVRITVLAQLLFFIGWAGMEEWSRARAPVVLLETVPVDPRDILSGYYMRLNLKISSFICSKPGLRLKGQVAVLLEPEREVEIGGKRHMIWQAIDCKSAGSKMRETAATGQGLWVIGEIKGRRRRGLNIDFGIDRYYFSEERREDMNRLRSGGFYIQAGVARNGRLFIKDLIHKERQIE